MDPARGVARRGLVARLPRRHILVSLTFLACVIAYTDRVNISVAAVAMKEQFGWSQTQKGYVLAAFFVGYLLSMFVAGLLAHRFGGKRVLSHSVLAWSVITLLTPAAAGLSIALLIVARIGLGVGEAGAYPSIYELFGRWVPAAERARALARMNSGNPFGTVIGLIVSGWLVERYGWATPFYVFGFIGLIWLIVWFRQVEIIEVQRGDAQAALAAAQQEPPGPWQDSALALARQIGSARSAADAALRTLIEKDAGGSAYPIAQVYALRNDAQETFEWLDRAWDNRDAGIIFLLYDPFIQRYKDDSRFAAICRKVGLPVPGKVRQHT